MDDSNRRRRQNESPYPAQDSRYVSDQSQSRGMPMSISDRYRSAATTGSPSMSRGIGPAPSYNTGYYPDPTSTSSFSTAIPPNPLQYQSTYPSDQRQQQSFSDYNTGMMYNQVTQQNPQNNGYDGQQFQTRQPAAMQMLPDVAAPYLPNDPSNTPGTQQYASSNSSTPYQHHQQSPGDRASLIPQAYSQNVGLGGMTSAPASADNMDSGNVQSQGGAGSMEEAYAVYQNALKLVFKNIIDLRLAEASSSLLEVSEWLLANVVELGLTVDEVSLHTDRIRLWNEFNAAWLGIFTRQQDFLGSGQHLQPQQTLMSFEFIGKMATNLIRLCDSVEKYGLVDYQYGVAEAQIMDILLSCQKAQELYEATAASTAGASSSNTNVGRAPP